MSTRKNRIAETLGLKIRDLRRQKKITLIELSELTGIAQATLSRIETGLMVGTVESHQKIAETLGVSISELYREVDTRAEKTGRLSPSQFKQVTTKSDQISCELLTQDISKKKITPLLIRLHAQAKSDRQQLERGVEKFLYVLEGTVKVTLGTEEYLLNKEDTLYFDASLPHQLFNTSVKEVKIFCAVSPSKI